jgi:hypothetical protein
MVNHAVCDLLQAETVPCHMIQESFAYVQAVLVPGAQKLAFSDRGDLERAESGIRAAKCPWFLQYGEWRLAVRAG